MLALKFLAEAIGGLVAVAVGARLYRKLKQPALRIGQPVYPNQRPQYCTFVVDEKNPEGRMVDVEVPECGLASVKTGARRLRPIPKDQRSSESALQALRVDALSDSRTEPEPDLFADGTR